MKWDSFGGRSSGPYVGGHRSGSGGVDMVSEGSTTQQERARVLSRRELGVIWKAADYFEAVLQNALKGLKKCAAEGTMTTVRKAVAA